MLARRLCIKLVKYFEFVQDQKKYLIYLQILQYFHTLNMLTNKINSIPMKATIFYICTPDGRNISSKQNYNRVLTISKVTVSCFH